MSDLFQNDKQASGGGAPGGEVECLGLTFPDDAARRSHFLKLLAEKLQDPAFRNQAGFPRGTDEAILALSDPPWYTACPNPWLADFVRRYGTPYDPDAAYAREPMAVDVSVGKTDGLYRAHAYHTKVPHLAIVPSILHYTAPGDLVLDGFAGSGMTGVAAQWCGTAPASYRHRIEAAWRQAGRPAPVWGARRAVLNDLSPAATFIAANYNLPFDVDAFATAGRQLLADVERETGWMYETLHTDGQTQGRIDYTVWSEVFTCPECAGEIDFLAEALEAGSQRVRASFPCPHCGAELDKKRLERVLQTRRDPVTGDLWQCVKFVPVRMAYRVGEARYEKQPDRRDFARLARIEALPFPPAVPSVRFPVETMYHGSRIAPKGFTNVHHLFLPRAAQAIGLLWEKARNFPDPRIRSCLVFMVEQAIWGLSILNRYNPSHFSQVNRQLNGTYYVPSQVAECRPGYNLGGKFDRLVKAFQTYRPQSGNTVASTGSAAHIPLPDDCIDYIFTDPPFGENIHYAELNFLVEAWHGVTTDTTPEAIIDRLKHKALPDYQYLMQQCLAEYHRVLKPGRWMTLVFSNSRAAVWNAIQVALQQAGLVVAEVTVLDKQQGSYRQVTSITGVKQDLMISAYKPNGGLGQRLAEQGATPEAAWDFVRNHLRRLPVTRVKDGTLETVIERDPRRLYDRMVAWFVRHHCPVPLSSGAFLAGLEDRYVERDGMIFLPEQVAGYDSQRARAGQAPQLALFVDEERSAIDWLASFLRQRPSTYQDIHPAFTVQIGAGWKRHEEKPELAALLAGNFLRYNGRGAVPDPIRKVLSRHSEDMHALAADDPELQAQAQDHWYVPDRHQASDLARKRERSLLKAFESFKATLSGRIPRTFRLEVLRAGFRAAWMAGDYATIISVAHKLPEDALREDEKLLLWYDQAITRIEAKAPDTDAGGTDASGTGA